MKSAGMHRHRVMRKVWLALVGSLLLSLLALVLPATSGASTPALLRSPTCTTSVCAHRESSPLTAASASTQNPPVTQTSMGYWEIASDGGIFSFGAAQFHGSMGGKPLNKPIVGMAVTKTGGGYWEVASDGGIFSFGNAQFHGSMGGKPLNQPIVGMAADFATGGYWFVSATGGIFSFDAPFHGSATGHAGSPVVGMAPAPTGNGYWIGDATGQVFAEGVPSDGTMTGKPLNEPMVGFAVS